MVVDSQCGWNCFDFPKLGLSASEWPTWFVSVGCRLPGERSDEINSRSRYDIGLSMARFWYRTQQFISHHRPCTTYRDPGAISANTVRFVFCFICCCCWCCWCCWCCCCWWCCWCCCCWCCVCCPWGFKYSPNTVHCWKRLCQTVKYVSGMQAASTKLNLAGFGRHWVYGTLTYSAYPPPLVSAQTSAPIFNPYWERCSSDEQNEEEEDGEATGLLKDAVLASSPIPTITPLTSRPGIVECPGGGG